MARPMDRLLVASETGAAQWLLRYLWRRLQQLNRPVRAKRNVAHHYDLDRRLYALFLNSDQQHS
jgi:cyclopropane-fatty-acyl-phospholipid synthase